MDFKFLPLLPVGLGVASHLFYFKIGERHQYPLRYVQVLILACIVTTVSMSHYGNIPTQLALARTAMYAGLYLVGLFTSVITYRLFFNPLNKIPGPYWARLTRFDLVFRVAAKSNCHHTLHKLHQKYGQFVRIGPNDVSVTNPEGVEVISGAKSKCIKGQWYSQDVPLVSMHTTRDRAQHDRRRRIWSPAFSDKALRGYEERVKKYNELLLSQIQANVGAPMDMSKWFNLYSFDVMGDLGFNKSFNMLNSGELHWAIKLLNEGMDPMGLCLPPWLFRVLTAIPGAAGGYWRFIEYCSNCLKERMDAHGEKVEHTDITNTLIEHFNQTDSQTQKVALPMLQGDTRLIIVAGSDTTAATLVHLFYHIASVKGLIQDLRAEINSLLGGEQAKVDHQKIQDAPLLNGSINEALRLNPPVPSGVFRKTPREGVEIAGTYIPGDTVIQMPNYAIGHDPRLYPNPEAFIPQRFIDAVPNRLNTHKDSFGPFSVGPYGCIGKNLAYMEIRMLTAELIRKFDVALAPGEDGTRLMMDTKDHFTLGLAPLDLVWTPRK